ncbi:hypothetical protein E2C01_096350 [Portunus trituberculatus]|uniref:Uncharacterized protein n=1 Tax=Portunus trituberculatus TaxID=210409 RepID=A0A5B7K2S3_PORTR|nr:hypothetical protein [Portunus trituberculatus]
MSPGSVEAYFVVCSFYSPAAGDMSLLRNGWLCRQTSRRPTVSVNNRVKGVEDSKVVHVQGTCWLLPGRHASPSQPSTFKLQEEG